mmetsp:Transcript_571/g.2291  ORF Transcript_571/g.2291 Transcript_571/m.2291 type:complete len:340 (+) Transcript_571:477-1496(+)
MSADRLVEREDAEGSGRVQGGQALLQLASDVHPHAPPGHGPGAVHYERHVAARGSGPEEHVVGGAPERARVLRRSPGRPPTRCGLRCLCARRRSPPLLRPSLTQPGGGLDCGLVGGGCHAREVPLDLRQPRARRLLLLLLGGGPHAPEPLDAGLPRSPGRCLALPRSRPRSQVRLHGRPLGCGGALRTRRRLPRLGQGRRCCLRLLRGPARRGRCACRLGRRHGIGRSLQRGLRRSQALSQGTLALPQLRQRPLCPQRQRLQAPHPLQQPAPRGPGRLRKGALQGRGLRGCLAQCPGPLFAQLGLPILPERLGGAGVGARRSRGEGVERSEPALRSVFL